MISRTLGQFLDALVAMFWHHQYMLGGRDDDRPETPQAVICGPSEKTRQSATSSRIAGPRVALPPSPRACASHTADRDPTSFHAKSASITPAFDGAFHHRIVDRDRG
jgi:hypothetical protein